MNNKIYYQEINIPDGFEAIIKDNKVILKRRESEDEQHRNWILEYLYDGLRKSDEQFKDQFKYAIAWLEKQGQETSWKPSKEDDVRRRSTIQILEYARCLNTYNIYGKATIDKNIAWLEKQGEQPKWSKEDEDFYQDTLDAFEALANDLNPSEDWGKLYDWLKSLKQRIGG